MYQAFTDARGFTQYILAFFPFEKHKKTEARRACWSSRDKREVRCLLISEAQLLSISFFSPPIPDHSDCSHKLRLGVLWFERLGSPNLSVHLKPLRKKAGSWATSPVSPSLAGLKGDQVSSCVTGASGMLCSSCLVCPWGPPAQMLRTLPSEYSGIPKPWGQSTKGDQPSQFAQDWGVPPEVEISVLKLGKSQISQNHLLIGWSPYEFSRQLTT